MRRSNLEKLEDVVAPPGYQVRTYHEGDEVSWARIINSSFKEKGWNAEKCRKLLTNRMQFDPQGFFFVTYRGKPVGTACAWRQSADETKVGYVHMVGVMPEHRGKGLGRLLTLCTLHYFRVKGFQEAILDTDDSRIPAIRTYLNLGFEPVYGEEDHRNRWRIIFEKLGWKAKSKKLTWSSNTILS